jgi:uncharacterized membrane protein
MPSAPTPGRKEPPARAGGKAGALPPPEPALRHRALAALIVGLLSLVGLLGFNIEAQRAILVVIYSLLAGATALWLALTAMRRARRSRTARPPGSVAAIVIAGVGIGLAGVMLMAFGLFGRQLSDYGRCLSGANTIAGSQSCYSRFSHALDREIGLTGRR